MTSNSQENDGEKGQSSNTNTNVETPSMTITTTIGVIAMLRSINHLDESADIRDQIQAAVNHSNPLSSTDNKTDIVNIVLSYQQNNPGPFGYYLQYYLDYYHQQKLQQDQLRVSGVGSVSASEGQLNGATETKPSTTTSTPILGPSSASTAVAPVTTSGIKLSMKQKLEQMRLKKKQEEEKKKLQDAETDAALVEFAASFQGKKHGASKTFQHAVFVHGGVEGSSDLQPSDSPKTSSTPKLNRNQHQRNPFEARNPPATNKHIDSDSNQGSSQTQTDPRGSSSSTTPASLVNAKQGAFHIASFLKQMDTTKDVLAHREIKKSRREGRDPDQFFVNAAKNSNEPNSGLIVNDAPLLITDSSVTLSSGFGYSDRDSTSHETSAERYQRDCMNPLSTNLYVGYVSPLIDEEQLVLQFGRYGDISSVKIMWPRTEEEKERQRNCGFVSFMRRSDAEAAKEALTDKNLHGLRLQLDWSKPVRIPLEPLFSQKQVLWALQNSAPLSHYQSNPPSAQDHTSASTSTSTSSFRGMDDDTAPPQDEPSTFKLHSTTAPSVEKVLKSTYAIPSGSTRLDINFPDDPVIRRCIDITAYYLARFGQVFLTNLLLQETGSSLPDTVFPPSSKYHFITNTEAKYHPYFFWRLLSLLTGSTLDTYHTGPFQPVSLGVFMIPPRPQDATKQFVSSKDKIEFILAHADFYKDSSKNHSSELSSELSSGPNETAWKRQKIDSTQSFSSLTEETKEFLLREFNQIDITDLVVERTGKLMGNNHFQFDDDSLSESSESETEQQAQLGFEGVGEGEGDGDGDGMDTPASNSTLTGMLHLQMNTIGESDPTLSNLSLAKLRSSLTDEFNFNSDLFRVARREEDKLNGVPASRRRHTTALKLPKRKKQRLIDILRLQDGSRQLIELGMMFILDNATYAEEIVEIVIDSLCIDETPLYKKLARLYVISDVLFNCSIGSTSIPLPNQPIQETLSVHSSLSTSSFIRMNNKNIATYRSLFQTSLKRAFHALHLTLLRIPGQINAAQMKEKIASILTAWAKWALFPSFVFTELKNIFLYGHGNSN